MWFGAIPVYLASLSVSMGLANAEIGFYLLLYHLFSSLSQPFFGRLSERYGSRPFGIGSILWTASMFSGTVFVESKVALGIFIALAGLGSGAWHPQGVANATLAGGARWGATAAAIFFLGGTLGSTTGSAASGVLLDNFGRVSLLAISAVAVLLNLLVVRPWIPARLPAVHKSVTSRAANGLSGKALWGLLAFLLAATALRSLTNQSLMNYFPKYQQDLGLAPSQYGLLMSAFLFTIAIGGVMGAYVADRVGIRNVLIGTLVLGGVLLYAFLHSTGAMSHIAFVLSGLVLGPSSTLFVVAAQRRFPERMALISGLILGFTFVSGGGGAWVLGLVADRIGLGAALNVLPWAILGAALCSLVAVPRGEPRQAEAVPS